ncbi:hypothetical protein TCSYLVIO_005203 [Trypanosoma cruzi]|nr:hypothetical protein TCSYLVIO_005203 [Trypanosoma cruzi]
MEREGAGRSTADTARERRQHEEKAAGPAAQSTHHETASTQGRHTTPAATHHAGEDIHHHLPQLIPAAPHSAHGADEPSSIHHAAQNFLPSRHQWDTEPNSAQPHAVHHTHRKLDSVCAPSPLLMATEKDNSRHTQLPACTTKGAFISTAMCILCVCVIVCACSNTKQRRGKEGAEYVERRTKCTAGTHNGNNNKKTAQTHDCTAAQAAAIHTIFIANKKRPLRLM